jgi:coenzyme F420-reducing hydrogenase alpha subunit
LVGSLAESHGNGLLTRLAAQLFELARLTADLVGSRSPDLTAPAASEEGLGLAQVQAARGLLVHRVLVAEDRVTDYRILAPTEWSFHPKGAVATGLADLARRADHADLLPLARLFVAAVDPCVDFELELASPRCVINP